MPIELASSAQASAPALAKIRQQAHQRRRFRRREAGFNERPREAGAQRADHRAAALIGMGDKLADRGLAVGPGNGDQRQACARLAADQMRQRTGERPQAIDLQIGCGQRRIPGKIAARLPEHGNRAPGDGVRNIATAIGQVARIGEENVSRPYLTTVVGHPGRHDAQPARRSRISRGALTAAPFRPRIGHLDRRVLAESPACAASRP